jgi:hypothetical protein
VAVPEFAEPYLGGRLQGAGHGPLQALQQGTGQAGAGLTVGGVGEGQLGAAAQLAAGTIAVQDLLHEEVGGDDGAEFAVAPAVADGAAEVADEGFGKGVGATALEALEGLCDTEHGGLLRRWVFGYLHFRRRPRRLPGQRKGLYIKALRLVFRVFGTA